MLKYASGCASKLMHQGSFRGQIWHEWRWITYNQIVEQTTAQQHTDREKKNNVKRNFCFLLKNTSELWNANGNAKSRENARKWTIKMRSLIVCVCLCMNLNIGFKAFSAICRCRIITDVSCDGTVTHRLGTGNSKLWGRTNIYTY